MYCKVENIKVLLDGIIHVVFFLMILKESVPDEALCAPSCRPARPSRSLFAGLPGQYGRSRPAPPGPEASGCADRPETAFYGGFEACIRWRMIRFPSK